MQLNTAEKLDPFKFKVKNFVELKKKIYKKINENINACIFKFRKNNF